MDLLTKVTLVILLSFGAEVQECAATAEEECQVIGEQQEHPYPKLTEGECGEQSMTACCKHDGFGAQYQAMMNIYLYTRFIGWQYCVSEWYHMSHNEAPMELFRWVGGHLYGPRRKPKTFEMPLRHLKWPIQSRNQAGKDELRGFYFSQPKPKILLDQPKHFAIHIRRGDMMEKYSDSKIGYIRDEQNVEAILIIKDLYEDDFRRIHILSDGKEEDFKNFLEDLRAKDIEYKLHLKAQVPLKEAFHHMVMADVLIYGPSEFCRSAAFLNGGGMVYHVHNLLDGSDEPTHLFDILPGTKATDNGYFAG